MFSYLQLPVPFYTTILAMLNPYGWQLW